MNKYLISCFTIYKNGGYGVADMDVICNKKDISNLVSIRESISEKFQCKKVHIISIVLLEKESFPKKISRFVNFIKNSLFGRK